MLRYAPLLGALLLFCFSPAVSTADSPKKQARSWNRFHGPDGNGAFVNGSLPASFTDAEATTETIERAKSWSVPLGARDVGSPIIHGGSCYLLVSNPSQSRIQFQSRNVQTGDLRWAKSFAQSNYHLHHRNTLAATTPTTDQSYVYFTYSDAVHTWLIALRQTDGEVVWKRDFGTWQSSHGFGASPQVVDDKVIVLLSQQAERLDAGKSPGESHLVAIDSKSGADVWSTQLTATRCCYGVPAIYENESGKFLVGANTGNGLFAIDVVDGTFAWQQLAFEMRCCSTPLIVDGIAIGTSGSGGGGNHLVAVKIPKDDHEEPEQIYRRDKYAPYVPSPAVKDGKLFTVDDKGIAACLRARDGQLFWKQRLGGKFGASPIIIGEHVLLTSLNGEAFVLNASENYASVCEFELGGPVEASPAFDGKHLLIRVGETLNCWSL